MKKQDMRERLEKAASVADIKRIAADCVQSKQNFNALVDCMPDKDTHVFSMAAWAMSHAVIQNPDILSVSHHLNFIKIAKAANSSALKRNIMRAWQVSEIPHELRFEVAEIALSFLMRPKEDVAIKAFSITVLQHIVRHIPELREEIIFILEKDISHASAAYINRARQFMSGTSPSL